MKTSTALAALLFTFSDAVNKLTIPIPECTALFAPADETLDMCQAYAQDGWTFAFRKDHVNALAACAYGGGWMDAGLTYGLLEMKDAIAKPPIMKGVVASWNYDLSNTMAACLTEKTIRYRRMFTNAIKSIAPAPDSATTTYNFAVAVKKEAADVLALGNEPNDRPNLATSLVWYSYGYGWLDFAVRVGLLQVTGDRSLFTI